MQMVIHAVRVHREIIIVAHMKMLFVAQITFIVVPKVHRAIQQVVDVERSVIHQSHCFITVVYHQTILSF